MVGSQPPSDEPASTAERPDPLERAGWALLVLLTLAVVAMALFRPTDPAGVLNEIRLAAGFDRIEARVAKVETDMPVLKWMIGANIALTILVLGRLLIP